MEVFSESGNFLFEREVLRFRLVQFFPHPKIQTLFGGRVNFRLEGSGDIFIAELIDLGLKGLWG